MARVALLGGSFNPPHVAHQMACLWVLSVGRADQVWIVPCYQHAFAKPLQPFEHRRAMCERAAGAFDAGQVRVSAIEAEIGGESRTLCTVERLLADFPQHRFSLLIGADILAETDSWYRFDRVRELVELIVVGRQGYPPVADAPQLPAISSSDVRRRIAEGAPPTDLVPAAVLDYIQLHGLYR